MALKDYQPRVLAPAQHERDLIDAAQEVIQQAQALRGDFPLREAKLRDAADLFDNASAQASELFDKLEDRRRGIERAAETAQHAKTAAEAVRSDLTESRASALRAAQAALSVQADTEAVRQENHTLMEAVDAARIDLAAFLEDMKLTREEIADLKSQSRPFAPGAAPGDAPGTQLTSVPQMYPGGPSVLGFLYSQIQATDLTAGITLTAGPKLTFTATAAARSGAFGLFLDKPDKTNTTNPHSLIYEVGGNPLWEWGVDFNTNNSINGGTGGSYLAMFDHTANANAGADIWALSPAEQDSVSVTVKATKWAFVGTGTGSAKDLTHLATLSTGTAVDLGGLSMTIKSQNARDHFTMVNAHATSKRNVLNFGGFWKMGSDMAGAGTTEFILRDNTNSLNRVYVENTSALLAKVGVNTTAPLANLYSAVTADASLFDTAQTGLGVGYSTINNRTWQVQYITDASQVEVINWFFGTLGSTSTRAIPTATSATIATGIKVNQVGGQLISAASGTNTTIVAPLNWTSAAGAAKIGFLGTAAVVQQVGASAAGIASIADAPAKAAITAIQNALAAFGLVTAPA